MSFKPKFTGKPTTSKPTSNATWKNRPFLILKYKGSEDEQPTLMAFLSEKDGKYGKYFSGVELVLGDDGKPTVGADGKKVTTGTSYFFDPRTMKLTAKTGDEKIEIAQLKASSKFEGSFFGRNEEEVQFYVDKPKAK